MTKRPRHSHLWHRPPRGLDDPSALAVQPPGNSMVVIRTRGTGSRQLDGMHPHSRYGFPATRWYAPALAVQAPGSSMVVIRTCGTSSRQFDGGHPHLRYSLPAARWWSSALAAQAPGSSMVVIRTCGEQKMSILQPQFDTI
jgi:uncharacterized protein (DUF2237 family)